jgi:hypothetical protein
MRIAILGAGNAGVCAALELASRGFPVDLYDENERPITRASFINEGKVHLGILYAKDQTLATARLMIRGALSFASLLDRWIGFDADTFTVSTPFYYGVHAGTMVSVAALKAHYASCKQLFAEAQAAHGGTYLGLDRSIAVDELDRTELGRLVSPEHFIALFRTSERAVDPRGVAVRLRAAALEHPRIQFVGQARVTAVSRPAQGGLAVTFRRDGHVQTERYDQVANTLWHGRLEIDGIMGLRPPHPWMYRYKFANRVFVPLAADAIPSVTCVLGPFGDIVNYRDQGLFLSWYPTGMIATSTALRPPDWDGEIPLERRHDVFKRSHAAWLDRCPLLHSVRFDEKDVDPAGGVIFAWGETDVDDENSQLHERFNVGVHSVDGYHSVNTGKYTLSPFMGFKTAERILGLS